LIDLHTHTFESDGTDSPAGLVEKAAALGIRTLAITDHDTFTAHEPAITKATDLGLQIVRGVEVSTRANRRSVHLLAYWFHGVPPLEFQAWLRAMLTHRQERNRLLAEKLREMGLDITLAEVEARGRTITGRVHFAKVLIAKGYARTISDAFDRYIGEAAPGFVEMEDPQTPVAVAKVREFGGLPVLAHPVRLGMKNAEVEEAFIRQQVEAGLLGLEVMHSDHDEAARARYLALAEKYNLAPSGGSDYHGEVKPKVALGSGEAGNVAVPQAWLDRLASL